MSNKGVLKLIFDAPLQSYGRQSKWDSRDTGYYPSKSAVIGLIACAMGIERNNKYIDILSENLSVSIRIDKPGRPLEDLQTVNYPVQMAKGGIKDKGLYHPLLNKMYIQDAVFSVFIVGDINLLQKCFESLQNPVWQVFLGRKCCVPSVPICIEPPIENIEDIEKFIKESPINCIERLYKGKDDIVYFQYIIEDITGNIISFDNPDSRGQKYYKGRSLKKGIYTKRIEKVGGSFVLK